MFNHPPICGCSICDSVKCIVVVCAVGAIQAFIKRLLQACQLFTPPLICASLILLSELLKTRPALLHLSKLSQVRDFSEVSFIICYEL